MGEWLEGSATYIGLEKKVRFGHSVSAALVEHPYRFGDEVVDTSPNIT
jgi:hypothetical protein